MRFHEALLSAAPTLSQTMFISYHCVLMVQCDTGAVRDKSPGSGCCKTCTPQGLLFPRSFAENPSGCHGNPFITGSYCDIDLEQGSGVSAMASHHCCAFDDPLPFLEDMHSTRPHAEARTHKHTGIFVVVFVYFPQALWCVSVCVWKCTHK